MWKKKTSGNLRSKDATIRAPGLTTRSKKLLGAPGIAARSKDATKSIDWNLKESVVAGPITSFPTAFVSVHRSQAEPRSTLKTRPQAGGNGSPGGGLPSFVWYSI